MRPRILLIELVALIALTVADFKGLVPLSRTPFLLLICWASLRFRSLGWRDIGFAPPPRWARAIGIGIISGLALELFAIGVTTPLIESITGKPPDFSEFSDVQGNIVLLLIYLALSWILAAFGEELAFRGYLMNRVADLFHGSRSGWMVSLLAVSLFFGIGHGYQGVTGLAQETFSGMLLGLLFLACGRNLTVPIVAHGVSNSLAFILIYLGRYPGIY